MNTTVTGSVATLLLITHEMHFLVSDQWGGQYYQIARALESLAISEHGNTHEQTE